MTVLVDGYNEGADFGDMLYKWIISGFILILLCYQIYIETIESTGTPLLEYFTTPQNYLDIFTYATTAILVFV